MKKFFILVLSVSFLLTAFHPAASAQTNNNPSRYVDMTNADGANVDTDTVHLTLKVPNFYPYLSFHFKQTKASTGGGTVAGYALLQCSNVLVPGANDWFDVNTDTCTFTNQTVNKKLWLIYPTIGTGTSGPKYCQWYRVTILTSGTQNSTGSCRVGELREQKIQ